LDMLPTVKNPDVAKVLIDLIRDESIRGIRSRVSVAAMSLFVKPEPEVVRSLVVSITDVVTIQSAKFAQACTTCC